MRILSALLVLLAAFGASAQPEDAAAREARRWFEIGRAHHDRGEYAQAIDAWQKGYEKKPFPEFLVNIGQAHRKAGQYEKAVEWYVRFLDESPREDRERRKEVAQIIVELRAQIAAAAPVEPPPAPVAPKPERRRPFIARHWWIIPTTVVVAAGVVVGAVLGSDPCRRSDVSCHTVHAASLLGVSW